LLEAHILPAAMERNSLQVLACLDIDTTKTKVRV
jgi:hypothetical protein